MNAHVNFMNAHINRYGTNPNDTFWEVLRDVTGTRYQFCPAPAFGGECIYARSWKGLRKKMAKRGINLPESPTRNDWTEIGKQFRVWEENDVA